MNLNYKTRLAILDKSIDFLQGFRKLQPGLKKAGSNWRCKSPFIKEKTPSFFVSPKKQIWHCFSTGKGGKGLVSFVMAKHDMKFIQALEFTEVQFGLKKNVKDQLTMTRVLESVKQQSEMSVEEEDLFIRIYEKQMHTFLRKFKATCKDTCGVLLPIIEYLWEEFDECDFVDYEDFRRFVSQAFRILRYFREAAIKPLNEWIGGIPNYIQTKEL